MSGEDALKQWRAARLSAHKFLSSNRGIVRAISELSARNGVTWTMCLWTTYSFTHEFDADQDDPLIGTTYPFAEIGLGSGEKGIEFEQLINKLLEMDERKNPLSQTASFVGDILFKSNGNYARPWFFLAPVNPEGREMVHSLSTPSTNVVAAAQKLAHSLTVCGNIYARTLAVPAPCYYDPETEQSIGRG